MGTASHRRLFVGRALQHLGTGWVRGLGERLEAARWPLEAGFRPGCVGVMLCADYLGAASQRDIGHEVGLDPSDVVGIIDILEDAGLVARERDQADRRRHAIVLTPLGRQRVGKLRVLVSDLNETMLAPLEEGERDRFGRLLETLVAHHRRR
jgi:DNA-binding MarR family transcriptional regulator